jgi:fructan beta-fructosidase
MSVPRTLELHETKQGLRLVQEPVRELEELRGERLQKRNINIEKLNAWLSGLNGKTSDNYVVGAPPSEIELELEPGNADFGLKLFAGNNQETNLRWDSKRNVISLDRTRSGLINFNPTFATSFEAPLAPLDGKIRLRLLLDVSSIEVFGNDGKSVMTALLFPQSPVGPVQFWSSNSGQEIRQFTAWKLKPAVPILEASGTNSTDSK